ncbi:hypothetical protein [Archangium sp.]|uniref:hypothetical protein n=1 Tax=Archangium sp. TaxID=1872627 RepID=UPI00286AFDCA|nr:hypothetical protein [Archangium sp.]
MDESSSPLSYSTSPTIADNKTWTQQPPVGAPDGCPPQVTSIDLVVTYQVLKNPQTKDLFVWVTLNGTKLAASADAAPLSIDSPMGRGWFWERIRLQMSVTTASEQFTQVASAPTTTQESATISSSVDYSIGTFGGELTANMSCGKTYGTTVSGVSVVDGSDNVNVIQTYSLGLYADGTPYDTARCGIPFVDPDSCWFTGSLLQADTLRDVPQIAKGDFPLVTQAVFKAPPGFSKGQGLSASLNLDISMGLKWVSLNTGLWGKIASLTGPLPGAVNVVSCDFSKQFPLMLAK